MNTNDESPRAWTAKECRENFQRHMFHMCQYWSEIENKTVMERMTGLCHSIQGYLDGRTLGSCAIDLVLSPHPSDKEYHISEGENWFEPGMVINDVSLTETFYAQDPNRNKDDVRL